MTLKGVHRNIVVLVLFLILALFPLVFYDPYLTHLLILSFLFSVVVSNWNILFGYMGIFCFGQQAFFGIGAYASALLAIRIGMPIPLAIVCGGIFAAISSLLIGLPSLRLHGAYIALMTLAFAEVMRMTCSNWVDMTRGQLGLTVPALISGAGRIGYYYISFALLLVSTVILLKIMRSSFGSVTVAIKESQEAASSLGINIVKYKLLAFMLSSFMTGIAGALYGHYILILTPDIMGLHTMITILVMGMLGGLASLPGPIIGAFVLIFLSEYLRDFAQFRFVIYGALIIFSVRFVPGGLINLVKRFEKKLMKIERVKC
jgi:branched-chain amino acid transport system permease protein